MEGTSSMRVLKYQAYGPIAFVPNDARVVHVAFQHNTPTVWALVPDQKKSFGERGVRFFTTGETVPENHQFVGTAINDDQTFVLHAFEETHS